MRPIVELATTMSFTAGHRSSPAAASSAGSSTTSRSPSNARSSPASSESASIVARKPTRPKLTPSTGTPVPRKRRSARSIVPSPPSTTARSASSSAPAAPSPCFATSSSGSRSSIPRARVRVRSRSSAPPIVSGRPCVTRAIRFTSGSRVVDPVLELIRNLRPLVLHQVQEELAVPLRAGQAGVYDADGLRPPRRRLACDLRQHPPPDVAVALDAAPRLAARRLELRLHEHDRLPAGSSEVERGRQRLAHAHKRDVTDDERRRERELPELPHVHTLEDRDARILADARVQLAVADVERDHLCCAALEQHVGEAARRGADVEAVASRRVDSERLECVRKLLPAARDEPRRLGHRHLGVVVHLLPGLRVPGHAAGEHQRLRLRPALHEPSFDQ